MTPGRWRQVRDVLDRAIDLDQSARDEFLTAACRADPELRREVESLLASSARSNTGLDSPLLPVESMVDLTVQPASLVAGHRIVAKLGEGGVAQVFEAISPGDGQRVALKIMRRDSYIDAGLRHRFLREARLARQLVHPNIVRVLEVIDDAEICAISMELVDGLPLSHHIPKSGMPIDRALRVALDICGALAEAHSRGIVHRDLKPENVMIDRAGSARVLDFGAAKQLLRENRNNGASSSTAAGIVIGTPVYMSPEQVRGDKVDFRSDIFSFGSLLYAMLAGRAPFKRRSMLATMSAVLREAVCPIQDVRRDVPQAVSLVLEKCLSKEPSKRFENFGAIASALGARYGVASV